MVKSILAIDPSFNNFAYSLFDVVNNKIYIDVIHHPLGNSIGFDTTFTASREVWEEFQKRFNAILKDGFISPEYVFSEVAPPTSNFSAGLFAIDTLMLSSIFDKYSTIKEMYSIPSSYLGTVHGFAKYQKSDSTKLAKYFIYEVLNDKFELVIPDNISDKGRKTKGTINNDKAESFLFLLRAIVKYDINNWGTIISNEMSGLAYASEKLLLKR